MHISRYNQGVHTIHSFSHTTSSLSDSHKDVLTFFERIPNVSLNISINIFIGFEPWIILKLFLNIEGLPMPQNQRIIFKSYMMCYFIIKANQKSIDSAKVSLQAVLELKYTKILDEL